jgi:beta-barrel assembly-enhancing protease
MLDRIRRTMLLKSVRTCIFAVFLTMLVSCATHNIVQAPTGRFQVQPGYNQYSPEQDIEIGRQASAEVIRQMPVLPDSSPATKYVQELGKQLASHAPGPNQWPFSFHAVNVKEINAFALPGGPMYVNVGTIQAAQDEAQLVGVLAHEMSHIVLRHGTQQASKQVFAQLPLAVLGAAVGRGAAGSLAQLGATFGIQSLFLKYSRDAEREADLLGSQIMYDAGYDPYSMVEFFSELEKKGGPGVPQFLSDHPNPGNRVQAVREAISKYPKKQYKKDSPDFERIKSQVAKLRPQTSQELAQRQQQQGQIGNISLQDVMPSGRFTTLDHSAFRISYPDNWQVFGDANSAATIAPRAAVSDNAIAYGVAINGIRAQSGKSFDQITSELVEAVRQSNPGMRVDGNMQSAQLNGAPARSVYLVGTSPLPGPNGAAGERDWLITVERPDNSVIYLICIAPDRDFERLNPAYQEMVRSFQLK